MNNGFTSILLGTGLKVIGLFILAFIMFRRWRRQTKRYFSDFPFLMGLTFVMYAVGKIYDLLVYYYLSNGQPFKDLSEIHSPYGLELIKLRFFFSPMLVIIPYVIIMLEIWMEGKVKWQVVITSSFSVSSITAILICQTYQQLLLINASISVVPVLISVISFFLIYKRKRMPEINSLLIAIGQLLFIIFQFIRPIWATIGGDPVWGLTWIAEIVETIPLILNGWGFLTPAPYADEV
ncbi:MAG: hypothetical protein DRO88_04330 [Promethearchaeia archaeon]|nr:MAG: hypothetical protein DRO88_04330 [Candidatus Lokiarchaeia archaeon]